MTPAARTPEFLIGPYSGNAMVRQLGGVVQDVAAGWFETPTSDLQESCFYLDCLDHFRETSDIDASVLRQILDGCPEAWRRHKCRRIAKLGAKYSAIIRSARCGCLAGVHMCPWTPEEFSGAQVFGSSLQAPQFAASAEKVRQRWAEAANLNPGD